MICVVSAFSDTEENLKILPIRSALDYLVLQDWFGSSVEFLSIQFTGSSSTGGSNTLCCAVVTYQIKIGDYILNVHVFEKALKINLEILLERDEEQHGMGL